jgi:adenine/guanine phosphoribosyltransferase-like PRPP-binding protein
VPTLTAPGGGVLVVSVVPAAAAAAPLDPPISIVRKSTPVPSASVSSWTSSERTSSSSGTALPKRTTVA